MAPKSFSGYAAYVAQEDKREDAVKLVGRMARRLGLEVPHTEPASTGLRSALGLLEFEAGDCKHIVSRC